MKLLLRAVVTALVALSIGCASRDARFIRFDYAGSDARFDREIDPYNEYFNPVLSGFHPDPSICRKGGDYFLVNSTFTFFPAIPVWHSRDLVNWRRVGYAVDRPSQLALDSLRFNRGVYAPDISYNPHNDTFYIINTCVDGVGNYVIKCKDPLAGGWSDPIPLSEVEGIDPSLFFDDDGRAYLLHNDMPPGERQWKSHRALWLREFDTERDCTVGERTLLLDGGLDFAAQPEWLEGPHLYKHEGRYYLLAAEGGTYEEHSQVALVSDDIRGPYAPCSVNPILTQRDLPADRADKVTSTGHADMVCTPDGEWWAVFLGCRPYDGDFYNTGRETFLLPVTWRDGGPVILPQGEAVPTVVRKEGLRPDGAGCLTGNFAWGTDFAEGLDGEWTMIRIPRTKWWRTSARGLELKDSGAGLCDTGNPAFVGYRQRHTCFTASAVMEFEPAAEGAFAGMALYQNERHNIVFGKTLRDGVPVLTVVSVCKEERTEYCAPVPALCADGAVTLRVSVDGGEGRFEAVFGDGAHEKTVVVASGVDLRGLSTRTARGFNGVFVGLYGGKI